MYSRIGSNWLLLNCSTRFLFTLGQEAGSSITEAGRWSYPEKTITGT